jgi:hypothetical protein
MNSNLNKINELLDFSAFRKGISDWSEKYSELFSDMFQTAKKEKKLIGVLILKGLFKINGRINANKIRDFNRDVIDRVGELYSMGEIDDHLRAVLLDRMSIVSDQILRNMPVVTGGMLDKAYLVTLGKEYSTSFMKSNADIFNMSKSLSLT